MTAQAASWILGLPLLTGCCSAASWRPSATLQGWTLPPLAARLGLEEDYPVGPESGLVGRAVSTLRIPEGALVALIARDRQLVAPGGATTLASGDHLFVITPRALRDAVDRVLQG